MTDTINKKTTNDKAATSNKSNASDNIQENSNQENSTHKINAHQNNVFPTMPTIPSDSPWLSAYERYGIDATIDMPDDNTSLLDVFERNFSRYGQKTAYICMGASISFKQLDLYSRQIASYLQSLGLAQGRQSWRNDAQPFAVSSGCFGNHSCRHGAGQRQPFVYQPRVIASAA